MIGQGKKRIWITLDEDVYLKAKEYAEKVTLSSLINRMMSDAFGIQPPRELKTRLPEELEE